MVASRAQWLAERHNAEPWAEATMGFAARHMGWAGLEFLMAGWFFLHGLLVLAV